MSSSSILGMTLPAMLGHIGSAIALLIFLCSCKELVRRAVSMVPSDLDSAAGL